MPLIKLRGKLLASAVVFTTSSGLAVAQNDPNPLQGQYLAPWLGGPSTQNNNNSWAAAIPGGVQTPQPGSVVIRMNGRVFTDIDISGGSGYRTAAGTIVPTSGGTPNIAGYKLNSLGVASNASLFPGIDGMAANGMRYGAAVEIRMNVEGGNNFAVSSAPTTVPGSTAITTTLPSGTATSGVAASASGVSSAQTLFVRRAFVYLGSDQTGIVRIGGQNGVPGLFDYTGTFTIGSWDGGIANIDNSNFQAVSPSQYTISWPFVASNSTEYGDTKIVYLSPQFSGFDFGIEYGPNEGNIFANSSTSSPYQVGPCNAASADCISVTSGTDGSRWINRGGFGGRYIGNFGDLSVQGYGAYIVSGKASIAGGGIQASPSNLEANPAVAGLAGGGSPSGSLRYDGLSLFNGGIAVSYEGITFNADVTRGRTNGSNALDPTGGAPDNAELVGLSYANGPFSIGMIAAVIDSQGSAQLVGTSQRHEVALAVGGSYRLAPGINLSLLYQYVQKHQGAYNFNTGANGVRSGNDIHGGGLTIATIVSW